MGLDLHHSESGTWRLWKIAVVILKEKWPTEWWWNWLLCAIRLSERSPCLHRDFSKVLCQCVPLERLKSALALILCVSAVGVKLCCCFFFSKDVSSLFCWWCYFCSPPTFKFFPLICHHLCIYTQTQTFRFIWLSYMCYISQTLKYAVKNCLTNCFS